MEKLGLIKKNDGKKKVIWESLKKNLNLLNLNVNPNDANPDDAAYVFNAFCPITIRLIEEAIGRGWGSIKEELKKLSGGCEYPQNEREVVMPRKNKTNFVLLVFVGGVTYAEIAAIRFLNKTKRDHKFFILTTHITSGKKIIDNLRLSFTNSMTLNDFSSQLKLIK